MTKSITEVVKCKGCRYVFPRLKRRKSSCEQKKKKEKQKEKTIIGNTTPYGIRRNKSIPLGTSTDCRLTTKGRHESCRPNV